MMLIIKNKSIDQFSLTLFCCIFKLNINESLKLNKPTCPKKRVPIYIIKLNLKKVNSQHNILIIFQLIKYSIFKTIKLFIWKKNKDLTFKLN